MGNEQLQLDYHGPNHTPDNIFIFAPAQQTLMLVDVLFPGWAPFQNLAVSQDLPGWIQAHDQAMAYPWTTLVGGHVGRLGVRADADLQKQYIADLHAAANAALSAVDPTPFFKKYGPTANAWAIFKAYFNAVASQAAEPVVAKYLGVLASVDVYTIDNALTMMEMLRVDAGMLGPFGNHP